MKLAEHRMALELLERHPGWSDGRVAAKLGVSRTAVFRWRRQAGLPAYTKKVTSWPRRAKPLQNPPHKRHGTNPPP